jgi:hypothetical protein
MMLPHALTAAPPYGVVQCHGYSLRHDGGAQIGGGPSAAVIGVLASATGLLALRQRHGRIDVDVEFAQVVVED